MNHNGFVKTRTGDTRFEHVSGNQIR
ncbi:hypothetical protein MPLB_250033 [Mesorhizobium sp. ORS 3324]|nr:hypothetical protein MPLB_250033 [Mesorhizobium sp. ORS 3324]